MNREQRRAAARAVCSKTRARPPRLKLQNPVEHTVAAVVPMRPDQRQGLALRNHGALHAITHGRGTGGEAAMLGAMSNVTLVLVELVTAQAAKQGDATQVDVAAEALGIVKRAQAALLAMNARAEQHGSYGFTGPELTAVNACLELHDQFADMASQGLFEHAVETAMARAQRGYVAANAEALERAA